MRTVGLPSIPLWNPQKARGLPIFLWCAGIKCSVRALLAGKLFPAATEVHHHGSRSALLDSPAAVIHILDSWFPLQAVRGAPSGISDLLTWRGPSGTGGPVLLPSFKVLEAVFLSFFCLGASQQVIQLQWGQCPGSFDS